MRKTHATDDLVQLRGPARHVLAAAAALALAACGGGGGSDGGSSAAATPPATDAPAAKPVVFSGVAATGSPLADATVTISDANGDDVCATTTNLQGGYECTLKTDAKAPFAIVARTADHRLYSSAPTAVSGTINVTPLTTLIVSLLSPNGNPDQFAEQLRADPNLATDDKVKARIDEVRNLIAPLQAAAAVKEDFNPLSGSFAADGSGHDKVLDSLTVSIRPEAQSANISVTLKLKPKSDDAAPVEVHFRSNESVPEAPVAKLEQNDLADNGMAMLVADFLGRLRSCYALPLAERIAGVAEGADSGSGGPSAVQASECRSLFVDGNPARFKDNGLTVGRSGAFSGMFQQRFTGAAFDLGNFEYLWANGDVQITFRSTTAAGAVGYSALTLRMQDGKLKAIGNQYQYAATVRPYVSNRQFLMQPQFDYLAIGYNVNITNKVDADGNMLFEKVVVTRPDGRTLTYRPWAGRSQLQIERDDGRLSTTSVEFAAAAFADPGTPGRPADKDPSPVYAPRQLSDDEIRAIPDQGVWTVEWVHRDRSRANVTQHYRTIERASTLGEVRQLQFAQFSKALEDEWSARDDVKSFRGLTFPEPSASAPSKLAIKTAGGADGWLVLNGAAAPTSVNAFGRSADEASFNDNAAVSTKDRYATLECTPQSHGDTHCDASTGTLQYATGNNRIWSVELWGLTQRQVEHATLLGLWRLAQ